MTRHSLDCDIVIVGAGVAGLRAALACAPHRVHLICKGSLTSGAASLWAQGGVAAAIGEDDSPARHANDTLQVAGGIADPHAVELVTEAAPRVIEFLISIGARFDRSESGELEVGREAMHSRRRIVHALGDATGAELMRALREAVLAADHITIFEGGEAIDLLQDLDGRVVGVLARQGDAIAMHRSRATVLATGGIGRLYLYTTNPLEATGDGLAMAARAGARMVDLEFVQFHPTALLADEDPLPLLTEALRGEGATLVDELGERFMLRVAPEAELLPRDVVSRTIWAHTRAGHHAFLDARGFAAGVFGERFPTAAGACARNGLNPETDLLPVTPAAHYHMGGIAIDDDGRTSLEGLWACGEVASPGVDGANRLASNSLLEALVFGERVADSILNSETAAPSDQVSTDDPIEFCEDAGRVRRIREIMWNGVGLVRNTRGLVAALDCLIDMPVDRTRVGNMVTVARLIATAALARTESRGSHHRTDFPVADPRQQHRLYVQWQGGDVRVTPGERIE